MVVVWTNGFTVQVPADIWGREASDLNLQKREVAVLLPSYSPQYYHKCVQVLYLEIDPTEASLLYSEVRRDLQESRSVTLLLDS